MMQAMPAIIKIPTEISVFLPYMMDSLNPIAIKMSRHNPQPEWKAMGI